MTTGFETYTMDYTAKVHVARSANGKWFTRTQVRDSRYGYRWTAWRSTVADQTNEYRLRPVAWRLPK